MAFLLRLLLSFQGVRFRLLIELGLAFLLYHLLSFQGFHLRLPLELGWRRAASSKRAGLRLQRLAMALRADFIRGLPPHELIALEAPRRSRTVQLNDAPVDHRAMRCRTALRGIDEASTVVMPLFEKHRPQRCH